MFTSLAGGNKFSKLDLSHAYQHIEVEEESQKYLIHVDHSDVSGLTQRDRLARPSSDLHTSS